MKGRIKTKILRKTIILRYGNEVLWKLENNQDVVVACGIHQWQLTSALHTRGRKGFRTYQIEFLGKKELAHAKSD